MFDSIKANNKATPLRQNGQSPQLSRMLSSVEDQKDNVCAFDLLSRHLTSLFVCRNVTNHRRFCYIGGTPLVAKRGEENLVDANLCYGELVSLEILVLKNKKEESETNLKILW